jgi:hypothetical protein
MAEKPTSGDAEQRERQTRVSREQSGLPPEPLQTENQDEQHEPTGRREGADGND